MQAPDATSNDTRSPGRFGPVRASGRHRQCGGCGLGALGLALAGALLALMSFLHAACMSLRVGLGLLGREIGTAAPTHRLRISRLACGGRATGFLGGARLTRLMVSQGLCATTGCLLLGLRRNFLVELALLLSGALLAIRLVQGNLLATQIGQHRLPLAPHALETVGDCKALLAVGVFLGLPGAGLRALAVNTRLLGAKVQAAHQTRRRGC